MDDHGYLAFQSGPDDLSPAPCDYYQRLIEAEATGICPEGDLLALMPSVGRDGGPWVDGQGWMRRLIGF